MRYRLMASYQGTPYQAGVGPAASDVTLFAACPPPEEHGFSSASGHWRKQVRINEIQALWESRPVGTYHGEPCLVLDDLGDRLHIAYLGMDEVRASQLGYWQVDRGVFEVVIPRGEVTDLAEERHEFPIAMLMATLMPLGLPAAEPTVADFPVPPFTDTGPFPVTGPIPMVGAAPATGPIPVTGPLPVVSPTITAPPLPVGTPSVPFQAVPSAVPAAPAAHVAPAAAWHGSPDDGGAWLPNSFGQPNRGTPFVEPEPTLVELPLGPPRVSEPAREVPQPAPEVPQPAPIASKPDTQQSGAVVRGRRAARKPRVATTSVFAELLDQASIPRTSYAVDEEVSGAMCLLKSGGGFEVFSCANDARHEVRFFEDEEAAYFYLFGVLAAEALRSGRLGPK